MERESQLLGLQRVFLSALREPIYGESRQPTWLPPRAGNVSGDFVRTAKDYIKPSARMRPVERLELYHRQYWYRLLESIEEDFPVLKRLLGKKRFWKLIEAYFLAVPLRSYTLRHLGYRLADFVAEHPELAGPRPVHAAELARLEYAVCETFEAAELPAIAPERLAEAPLGLQPHLKLFAFRTPAEAIWKTDDKPEDCRASVEAGRDRTAILRCCVSASIQAARPGARAGGISAFAHHCADRQFDRGD